jgi:5'-AMP-activated protein kinase catalytic alpha subunit
MLSLSSVLKMAKQKAVDDYEIGKTIGEGRYGKVKMGYHLKTGMKVAVKILTKSNIKNEEDLLRIQRETKILISLHHDNIIRVYDVYETPLQIYIIMEFAEGGDLYTHLVTQRTTALPIEDALPYFRQIVSAMLYCHARFVVHR